LWAEYLSLIGSGHNEEAVGRLVDYLARHPEDVGAQLEYGRALWRLERLGPAIVQYRRVLALEAGADVQLELARLHVAARNWDQALQIYDRLSRASHGDEQLLREYAEAATWAERYELAIPLFARLVDLQPEDPEIRVAWARALYWSGRSLQAADVLDRLPPHYQSASVDSLKTAITAALPPRPVAPSTLELARGYAMVGAVESALVLYRLEMLENPGADFILLEVADVFEYRADETDSAMVYLRAYLAGHPGDHEVRLRLARLLAWSGRFGEAEHEALLIVSARPDAAAWSILGDLYRWGGDRAAARRAYQRALEIDPEESSAAEGLASLQAALDAELAARGSSGPAGAFDYFADSDDFRIGRVIGAWSLGVPRTRAGLEAALEQLGGFDPSGGSADLTALDLHASAERWWLDGGLRTSAALGAWIPESGPAAEPTVSLGLEVPNWKGGSYGIEYRHEPGYRQTATLQAALAGLRVDIGSLQGYRFLSELSAAARFTAYSGAGSNRRFDGALAFFYRPDARWLLGWESRALAFADSAPNPGRSLYWDPQWSWDNALLFAWTNEPVTGWELEARVAPGISWLNERGLDPTVVFIVGGFVDARRRIGTWTVGGRAAFNQSRVDGYRSFALQLAASRSFGGFGE
jgi:Flp pilus assembly protein TadD